MHLVGRCLGTFRAQWSYKFDEDAKPAAGEVPNISFLGSQISSLSINQLALATLDMPTMAAFMYFQVQKSSSIRVGIFEECDDEEFQNENENGEDETKKDKAKGSPLISATFLWCTHTHHSFRSTRPASMCMKTVLEAGWSRGSPPAVLNLRRWLAGLPATWI